MWINHAYKNIQALGHQVQLQFSLWNYNTHNTQNKSIGISHLPLNSELSSVVKVHYTRNGVVLYTKKSMYLFSKEMGPAGEMQNTSFDEACKIRKGRSCWITERDTWLLGTWCSQWKQQNRLEELLPSSPYGTEALFCHTIKYGVTKIMCFLL